MRLYISTRRSPICQFVGPSFHRIVISAFFWSLTKEVAKPCTQNHGHRHKQSCAHPLRILPHTHTCSARRDGAITQSEDKRRRIWVLVTMLVSYENTKHRGAQSHILKQTSIKTKMLHRFATTSISIMKIMRKILFMNFIIMCLRRSCGTFLTPICSINVPRV